MCVFLENESILYVLYLLLVVDKNSVLSNHSFLVILSRKFLSCIFSCKKMLLLACISALNSIALIPVDNVRYSEEVQ